MSMGKAVVGAARVVMGVVEGLGRSGEMGGDGVWLLDSAVFFSSSPLPPSSLPALSLASLVAVVAKVFGSATEVVTDSLTVVGGFVGAFFFFFTRTGSPWYERPAILERRLSTVAVAEGFVEEGKGTTRGGELEEARRLMVREGMGQESRDAGGGGRRGWQGRGGAGWRQVAEKKWVIGLLIELHIVIISGNRLRQ